MANYNLVVDSKFEPFSFERYIQPYKIYTDAYKELENQYMDYADKVGIWENLINQETEAETYNQYKAYMNDLDAGVESLISEGLNPSQREKLLNMRRRYTKEIKAIENAYAQREAQRKEQQDLINKDPTLYIDRDASVTSLDDYLNNPQIGYKSFSGATLEAMSSKAAANLQRQIKDNPDKWMPILGGAYYELAQGYGLSSDEIMRAIENPEFVAELNKIYDDVLTSSGVDTWSNWDEIKDRVNADINRGFWSAIGKTDISRLQNPWLDKTGTKKEVPTEKTINFIKTGISSPEPEFEESQNLINGLRKSNNSTGYSTTMLDNDYQQYLTLVEEMNNLGTKEELEEFHKEWLRNPRASANIGGYKGGDTKRIDRYKEIQNEIAKMKKRQEALSKYASDWDHLADNDYDRIRLGSELEKTQQLIQEGTFLYNAESADYKNVIDSIDRALMSMRQVDIERQGNGLVLIQEDGSKKQLDYEDFKKVMEEPHQIVVRFTRKEPHIALISGNQEYEIKGIDNITKANRTLQTTNNFLSDFSKTGLQALLKEDEDIYTAHTIPLEALQSFNFETDLIPERLLAPVGHGYKGTFFRIDGTYNYVKILTDANGKVIAINSLNDELNEASNRTEIMQNLIKNINANYLTEFAIDYDK